jgi:hypothetical protein
MGQILDLTEGGLKMDGAGSKELAQFFQSAEVRKNSGPDTSLRWSRLERATSASPGCMRRTR